MKPQHAAALGPLVLAAALCTTPSLLAAQALYLCEGEGRAFAVAGPDGAPPGCREIADAQNELLLAPAQPDLVALARDVARLSERVARLEALLQRTTPRMAPAAPAPRPDPFDTRGRLRDLGQDLDRRLDERGR